MLQKQVDLQIHSNDITAISREIVPINYLITAAQK
jgi:hypothetical protein